jgi:hypothetical protein
MTLHAPVCESVFMPGVETRDRPTLWMNFGLMDTSAAIDPLDAPREHAFSGPTGETESGACEG